MARVLVVDDNPAIRLAMQTVLEADGHVVAEATSGLLVEMTVATSAFDLVILDMHMPGRDGIETIVEVRRAGHDVKIIAMSGSEERPGVSFLGAAKRLGADATLLKPFDAEELRRTMRQLLTAP
jgi:CheY-like chemotaxis protein